MTETANRQNGSDPNESARAPRISLGRLAPLIVLLAGLGLFFGLGLQKYLSFETLRDNREVLKAWTADHAILAVFAYIGTYIVVVAFSLPGGAVMTITGGFLFGTLFATLWTVLGATVGATVLFMAAKTGIGDFLRSKAGPTLERMEAGFRKDAFSYLMVLRLVPLFPFFLVNLAPAFLGVRLRTYVVATFLGIIPGTFVFSSIGNGLGAIFEQGGTPDLGTILQPEFLVPILGLAFLAMVPVAYKSFSAARPLE